MSNDKKRPYDHTPSAVFHDVYGDQKNIMTPNVVRHGRLGQNAVYELSKGTGIYREPIFGVTVLVRREGAWCKAYELSKGGFTADAADAYIDHLREVLT